MTVLYYTLILNITLFNIRLRHLFYANMDEPVPHSKCGPYILVTDVLETAHLFTYHIITYYMVLSHACNPGEDRWSTQSNFTPGYHIEDTVYSNMICSDTNTMPFYGHVLKILLSNFTLSKNSYMLLLLCLNILWLYCYIIFLFVMDSTTTSLLFCIVNWLIHFLRLSYPL